MRGRGYYRHLRSLRKIVLFFRCRDSIYSMNNRDFRTILSRIQDHLTENDRLRLNFILGRDDFVQSLNDPDKISEKDTNYLIKLFEEIHCDEAVKLLKGNLSFRSIE